EAVVCVAALARLFGGLFAALAHALGVGIPLLRLALGLGLFAALLLDAPGHVLALAGLVDDRHVASLLRLPAVRIAPVLMALRLAAPLLRLLPAHDRRLALLLASPRLLLALVVLLLARLAVLFVVVAALLREGGGRAAHGEQRAEQGGGQGAGSGKAGHLLSPVGTELAPRACS